MAYKVIVSIRAQKEIEDAIDYYSLRSDIAPINFINSLIEAYIVLETNPFLRSRYKNVRSLKLKRFPYSLYFIINNKGNKVRVLSCFHNRRNPKKLPGV